MKKLLTILSMVLVCYASSSNANSEDNLRLTDAEMQHLKKYFPAEEDLHLIWRGDPLKVQLPLGKEKRLVFPEHVTTNVKESLIKTAQLQLQNNDKSIYLTALTAFSDTRIYVTLQESGEVIFVDLSVSDEAGNETQYIDIKQNNKMSSIAEAVASSSEQPLELNDVSTVDLIRFAWQEIYSPEQLRKQYVRAPMRTQRFVSDLVYGDKVIAHPISSWMAGIYHVTAIALQNKYPISTKIDLKKDICGDWQAATIYPRSVLKTDRANDSATLFLVSQKPFGEALGVCHGNA